MNSLKREKYRAYIAMLLPGLILYSIFFILPICMGVYYSTTDWDGISRAFNYIGVKNYIKLFHDRTFLKVLLFTIRYTLLLVVFTIVISMLLAVLLNMKLKGTSFFRTVYFLSLIHI